MIEAGAAGVHYEVSFSSEKKRGYMRGEVLVPTSQFIRSLVAARLATDVMGVPTFIAARTDAGSVRKPNLPESGLRHLFIFGETRSA